MNNEQKYLKELAPAVYAELERILILDDACGYVDITKGLCTQLGIMCSCDLREALFKDWPHYTGCFTYPIPATRDYGDLHPEYDRDNILAAAYIDYAPN